MLTVVILVGGLVTGAIINLPGGSTGVIFQGSAIVVISAVLAMAVVLPFAFFASIGRGYLLPIAVAILLLMMANVAGLAGWGEYFPWAVPGLYAQTNTSLAPISYWIVFLTGLIGMLATYLWWMYADQNR
jgi:ABC-2 type transport system permease protein